MVNYDSSKNPKEVLLYQHYSQDGLENKTHTYRTTFVTPGTHLSNCDLLVVDEAAAIPINVLKPMIFNTFSPVIISSTTMGYEGTGRSLSLKLIEEIRKNVGSQEKTF